MSEISAEDRAEATRMGWQPVESFKGDPDKWIDADEFLRRGREVLPIVKAENRRLHDKTDQLSKEVQRLTAVVAEQSRSMSDLVEFSQTQLKEKLDEQKRQLSAQLREARRGDDDDLVETLKERLEENATARENLKTKPPVEKPRAPQEVNETPEYKEWASANPWYNGTSEEDRDKTETANAIALQLATSGKRGKAFFDAVDAKLAKLYPQQKREDPTEEGRPRGGSGSSSSSSSSGFNALPADAKAQARAQAAKFVGANKIFKTEKEWFDHFAKQYNQEAA